MVDGLEERQLEEHRSRSFFAAHLIASLGMFKKRPNLRSIFHRLCGSAEEEKPSTDGRATIRKLKEKAKAWGAENRRRIEAVRSENGGS